MLYKYRTLDNFQFLLDIIVNNRLYAAKFDDMNDPMEGAYTVQDMVDDAFHQELEESLGKVKICSLSEDGDHPLMWAHYANGNRGCVIGVELPEDANSEAVRYEGPSSIQLSHASTPEERARTVLTYKNDFWDYEQEVRFFVTEGNYQIVKVINITLGEKVDRTAASILQKIIKKVSPEIEIIKRSNK